MITESGVVTNATPSVAWIKTIRSGACEACSSKESCGTVNDQKEMIVTVDNTLNVEKGDHVVIGLETRPMLFLTFLLYVFPIILLTIGAVIGNSLALFFQMNPSLVSMASGFFLFGFSFYYIRKKNNSLSQRQEYKPFLVRKKSHVIPSGCSLP
ncbi:MAG: SoxR reducing system RseC family protein [Proteobacteria bacterium]|nr:SoxR reducing system RseC family protein [Pseudomonadota bacterium]MBU1585856.1 SoxR reducing system RseC family protein [Pseudomonadota bacterium]MBU2455134.1 SoxR reducing system RseC family protein [Pseudomonadota bacterium]